MTISEIHDAFEILFKALIDKKFSKSKGVDEWGEQELLFSVRTFLLGYFKEDMFEAEVKTALPGNRVGRLDFKIDDVAVEFAVRRSNDGKHILGNSTNKSESQKLIKYPGKSILILFDFSSNPLDKEELDLYREHPSLGKGNHNKYPYNISYFYKPFSGKHDSIKKVIRVN